MAQVQYVAAPEITWGERFHAYRRRSGLPLSVVAEAIQSVSPGASQSALSRLENVEHLPVRRPTKILVLLALLTYSHNEKAPFDPEPLGLSYDLLPPTWNVEKIRRDLKRALRSQQDSDRTARFCELAA